VASNVAANGSVTAAALAADCLAHAGASDRAETVQALILATRDHEASDEQDFHILLDVDLSILGADSRRFDEYEKQIRTEYQHVPAAIFSNARKEILEKFLRRPKIFKTRTFFDRYEQRARKNLNDALANLS
jgi:predicted metal-dependent HD superfamily phosphohydrolase